MKDQMIPIRMKDLGQEFKELIDILFAMALMVVGICFLGALVERQWWAIPAIIVGVYSGNRIRKFLKSRIKIKTRCLWLTSEGIKEAPDSPYSLLWVDVKQVSWPSQSEGNIRIGTHQEELNHLNSWSTKFQDVKRSDRGMFVRAVRKFCQATRHVNWDSFCFKLAIPALNISKFRSELVRCPALAQYLADLGRARGKSFDEQETHDQEKHNSLTSQLLLTSRLVSPFTLFATAGLVSCSAILNSYLIAGYWCAPVVNTCLIFSGVIVVIGLLVMLAQSWQFDPGFDNSETASDDNPAVIWTACFGTAYILLVPSAFAFSIWVGGGLGELLAFLSVFSLPISMALPVIFATHPRGSKRDAVVQSACRFWDLIERRSLV